jgi:hypothetical protein
MNAIVMFALFLVLLALTASLSPVVYNNLYVFQQGERNDGQLWYSVYDGTNWSGDTQIQNVGMSASPSAVAWAGGILVFHEGQPKRPALVHVFLRWHTLGCAFRSIAITESV